jgi:hypothetical protein
LEVGVVVLGVEMYGLHIPGEDHRGVRRWKATMCVVDVLGDLAQAGDELVVVWLDAGFQHGRVLPRPGVEGS